MIRFSWKPAKEKEKRDESATQAEENNVAKEWRRRGAAAGRRELGNAGFFGRRVSPWGRILPTAHFLKNHNTAKNSPHWEVWASFERRERDAPLEKPNGRGAAKKMLKFARTQHDRKSGEVVLRGVRIGKRKKKGERRSAKGSCRRGGIRLPVTDEGKTKKEGDAARSGSNDLKRSTARMERKFVRFLKNQKKLNEGAPMVLIEERRIEEDGRHVVFGSTTLLFRQKANRGNSGRCVQKRKVGKAKRKNWGRRQLIAQITRENSDNQPFCGLVRGGLSIHRATKLGRVKNLRGGWGGEGGGGVGGGVRSR